MPLLSLFFPRRCVSCGKVGRYICRSCRSKISYIRWQFCPVCRHPSLNGLTHPRCQNSFSLDGLFVPVHYKGPVKKALKMMKYRFVSDLAKELTGLFPDRFPSPYRKIDFLTPIPLHRKREKDRGFNQSYLIARYLSRKMNLPVKKYVIKRIKNTKPQFGLKISERGNNIKGAFTVSRPDLLKDKKIVLIDDVATTLSTLGECAKILKKAGAKKVYAFVIAHGN